MPLGCAAADAQADCVQLAAAQRGSCDHEASLLVVQERCACLSDVLRQLQQEVLPFVSNECSKLQHVQPTPSAVLLARCSGRPPAGLSRCSPSPPRTRAADTQPVSAMDALAASLRQQQEAVAASAAAAAAACLQERPWQSPGERGAASAASPGLGRLVGRLVGGLQADVARLQQQLAASKDLLQRQCRTPVARSRPEALASPLQQQHPDASLVPAWVRFSPCGARRSHSKGQRTTPHKQQQLLRPPPAAAFHTQVPSAESSSTSMASDADSHSSCSSGGLRPHPPTRVGAHRPHRRNSVGAPAAADAAGKLCREQNSVTAASLAALAAATLKKLERLATSEGATGSSRQR